MSNLPRLIGRFEIQSVLGQGAMGRVYLARDPLLDRQLAVKVLRTGSDEATDPALFERFNREARSAARLNHPNIVTIYDIGVHEGQPFIAMEYVSGHTLSFLIRRRIPLSLSRRMTIIAEIAAGLHFLHKANLVHRDVKPGNVMVGDDETVKILDFGIARFSQSSDTAVGTLIGSPSYMSPEQVRGDAVDSRSDIFSLGSVMYELLSGQQAFGGSSLPEVVHRIAIAKFTPLADLLPNVPHDLIQIANRAMQPDPAARYPSLDVMARDLQAVQAQLATALLPAGKWSGLDDPADPPRPAPASPSAESAPRPAPSGSYGDTLFVQPAAPIAAPEPLVDDGTVVVLPGAEAAADPALDPDVRLVVTESGDPRLVNQWFAVTGDAFEIGRDGSGLRSADPTWSRRHAVIEYRNRGFSIRDLGSANGTYVNGRAVRDTPLPLFFGARIAIGSTLLTFVPVRDTTLPDVRGAEIAGRYILSELLRESTRGAVYLAKAKNLPRDVALKLLSPELLRYAGYRERFRHQAEVASQLVHPHICKILDYGETVLTVAGSPPLRTEYLCLEYMAGGSLADRLAGDRTIETAEIVRWIDRLSDALGYAHERNVVHGDVKPTAIVFDRIGSGNLYLSDFAIGQPLEGGAVESAFFGSPAYMAPEQWTAAPVTAATDQYSLAALAYYMVTGSRPFEGQDHPEIRRRNLAQGPLPAHEEAARRGRSGVRPGVSAVLRRALAAEPADRFPSVTDFARSLIGVLTGAGDERDPNAPPRVFLSYQRGAGSGWANYIASQLRDKHGIEVFVDVQRIDGVLQFPARLANAIRRSDVFVCLLTPSALESRWIQEEVRLAHQHEKPMIPVFHENYEAPATTADAATPVEVLLSYEAVRLLDVQNLYVDAAIADLASRIRDNVTHRSR